MPMYEFICRECGHRFEELFFSLNDSLAPLTCPECGSRNVKKLMSAAAFGSNQSDSAGNCAPAGSGFT